MKMKAIVSGGVAVGLTLASWAGVEAAFWGKTWPGVRVADTYLGNKPRMEVQQRLESRLNSRSEVELRHGTQTWMVDFEELGVRYDAKATAAKAMEVGRSGRPLADGINRWKAIQYGAEVGVEYTLDEEKLNAVADKLAGELDIPAQEPAVTMTAGEIIVTAGENGQQVARAELLGRIRETIRQVGTKIEIPVTQLTPKLSEAQLGQAKKRAEAMLLKKIVITHEAENQEWEVGEDLVLVWLDPSTSTGWKRGRIEEWVTELAETVDRPAQNATFRFVGGGKVEEFRPAREGYMVKQGELVNELTRKLSVLETGGDKVLTLELPLAQTEPEITTGDVNDLGIKELIGKGESWYAGSITNRIFNLKKAAEALNGVLVAPGEMFSFNTTVGEISAATGYKQAYIIKNGQTILGDGGGVCQTSSTLFRAVLAAGLPIEARTAHAYRVSYYEQNYQVGFDATVFQPAPDFKFRNDTPGHILIQTEFDEAKKYLAFSFYGTNDGRKVELSKARMWDVTPPPPDLYIDDPNLAAGVVQQTEHRASGAKVAFDWKVTRGEEVLQERTFFSNYQPWQAVYLRGTKVN